MGAAEVERAFLHREPPCHFAHRREERQAPVGALDRLVGDRDRSRVAERPRQLGRRREVKVGEEDLARAEPRGLRRERLLDLQDELGALPDLVGGGQRRADGGVLVVTDPAAPAGAALDDDTVAGFGEGSGAGGRQRDARFARLDLARDPDDHRAPRAATDPRIGRLSRSARASVAEIHLTSRITGKSARGAPRNRARARRAARPP